MRRTAVFVVAAATLGLGSGVLGWQRAEAGGSRAAADPALTVVIRAGSGTVSSAPAGIGCPATCKATFQAGTSVTLTATPADGFRFDSWDGQAQCTVQPTVPNVCRISLGTTDTFVGATFRPAATLRVFPNGDGTIAVSPPGIDLGSGTTTSSCASAGHPGGCALAYLPGTRVTGTATAGAGRTFVGWGAAGCGSGPCTVEAPAGESALVATFDPLELQVRTSGKGIVRSSPAGIVCGDAELDCSESAPLGAVFVLDAGTSPHEWRFGCEPEGGDPHAARCTVTVGAAPTVAGVSFGGSGGPAEPGRISIRLDLLRTGPADAAVVGRKIDCKEAKCTATYKFGDGEELRPVDAPDGRFRRWVNGCGTTRVCRFPVGPITSLEAVFTPPLATRIVSVKTSGHEARRAVAARIRVNAPARVTLRLQRRGRIVAGKRFMVAAGATTLRLRVPARVARGRYALVAIVKAEGESRRISRAVRIGG